MNSERQTAPAPRRIAIVAPARRLDETAAEAVTKLAKSAGVPAELVFHSQCFARSGHFAGADEVRRAALVEVANAPDFDAVWFARGGYGSMRLLDGLTDELGPAALDKVYAGFSDTGALLATLYGAGIGTCVHAPMPANIRLEGGAPAILRTLEFLSAPPPPGRSGPPEAAFNLTILAALCGAPHFPNLAGHVLHLEDVGEYHYRIDRAFAQLAATPWFPALAGVRLGRFSEIPENNIDFGQTGEEIARAWCARAGVEVMADSPIGHDIHNGLVPFGPRPA